MAGRSGRAAGAFCCAASVWLCVLSLVTLEVALQLNGLVSQAELQLAAEPEPRGARRLYDDLEPHEHVQHEHDDVKHRHDAEMWVWLNPVIQVSIMLVTLIVSLLGCYCHWSCYIKPTPDRYVPRHAVVPSELMGRFKYGAFDCFAELGTCCCFTWCTPCMMADLWYRAGWIHATMGNNPVPADESCPGWRWCAGVCAYCVLADVAGCCMSCFFAAVRGGVQWVDGGDGGMGDVKPFRKLFGIEPHLGFNTFCADCCLYCWCLPCAGTQEYRQVLDLLNSGPIQVAPPPPVGAMMPQVVVGQAVYVQGTPLAGQPTNEAQK